VRVAVKKRGLLQRILDGLIKPKFLNIVSSCNTSFTVEHEKVENTAFKTESSLNIAGYNWCFRCIQYVCFGLFQKNFMWNTVTVQYNHMIEEEWDEHFKVTCEYGYDFWKTVTFPFLNVE